MKGEEDEEVFREEALRWIEGTEGEGEGEEGTGAFWVRPGCDGMRIAVGEGGVRDDVYG